MPHCSPNKAEASLRIQKKDHEVHYYEYMDTSLIFARQYHVGQLLLYFHLFPPEVLHSRAHAIKPLVFRKIFQGDCNHLTSSAFFKFSQYREAPFLLFTLSTLLPPHAFIPPGISRVSWLSNWRGCFPRKCQCDAGWTFHMVTGQHLWQLYIQNYSISSLERLYISLVWKASLSHLCKSQQRSQLATKPWWITDIEGNNIG